MSFDTVDLLTGNNFQVTWDLGRRCNYDCSYCPVTRHDNFSPHATLDELKSHNIKMVIYANQTLRVAHTAMKDLLTQISNHDNLANVSTKISSMEDIFELQEMYHLKNQEKNIESNLKKLGYV